MSTIAPSIHSRPPGPGTGWPRSSTQRTSPSARTIRYSNSNASPRALACSTPRMTASRSSGWTMLMIVRFALATKLCGG